MADNKTVPTDQSVEAFLNALPDEQKRQDSFAILKMMKDATGLEPQMWGSSIVGFGAYHYKYDSGHEGDAPLIGFSPRKQALTLYLVDTEQLGDQLANLGKYTTGKVCLYIKRLSQVDLPTLKHVIEVSYGLARKTYGGE